MKAPPSPIKKQHKHKNQHNRRVDVILRQSCVNRNTRNIVRPKQQVNLQVLKCRFNRVRQVNIFRFAVVSFEVITTKQIKQFPCNIPQVRRNIRKKQRTLIARVSQRFFTARVCCHLRQFLERFDQKNFVETLREF